MATKSEVQIYVSGMFNAVQRDELNTDLTGYGANFYDMVGVQHGQDDDGTPISVQKRVTYVVTDEGGAGEAAGVYEEKITNDVDRDLVSASGLLSDIRRIAVNNDMQYRVYAAAANAAKNVLNEGSGVANHTERSKLATDVLVNSSNWVGAFSWYVGMNATVQSAGGSASDSDLNYICQSEFPWTEISTAIYA